MGVGSLFNSSGMNCSDHPRANVAITYCLCKFLLGDIDIILVRNIYVINFAIGSLINVNIELIIEKQKGELI